MKQLYFLIAFGFFYTRAFSQNADALSTLKIIDSLIQVSRASANEGDFEKALAAHNAAEKLTLKDVGKESAAFGNICFNRGRILDFKEEFKEAEKWYVESANIRAKVLGKEHPDYAQSLASLALLLQGRGQFDRAESLFLELTEIRAKTPGKESDEYRRALTGLGVLYFEKGDLAKAETMFLEVKNIVAKVYGTESKEYAAALNNLGILNAEKGDYSATEMYYLEANDIQAKVLGKESPDYATSLNGLANLYYEKGDFPKSERMFLEAKDIFAKIDGTETENYAMVLTNLSHVYISLYDYKKAESMILEAKDIWAKTIGKEHPDYALTLESLAMVYVNENEYKKAEPLYLEALQIREKIQGKQHGEYATTLANLGDVYTELGDYGKAEALYLEAKGIHLKAYGKEHTYYGWSLEALSMFYQKIKKNQEAKAYFLELDKMNINLARKAADYSSENQLRAYLRNFEDATARFQSFNQLQPNDAELTREHYNSLLFFNGLTLENDRLLTRAIFKADTATRNLYDKWQDCHRRLAKRYARPVSERKKIAEVEAEAERYEKMLLRKLPGFRQTQKIPQWQDVRDRLRPGETANEFTHYRFQDPDKTDSVIYAALVLQPGWDAPKMIPLFEEKTLDSLLNSTGERKADYVANIYAVGDRGAVPVGKPRKSLYELIWEPLLPALGPSTRSEGSPSTAQTTLPVIYCSPSGLLHRINLSAIPFSPDSTLADRYHLVGLGSTRQLVAANDTKYKNNDVILFGGIQYDMDSTAILNAISGANSPGLAGRGASGDELTGGGASRGGTWNYLKWTEKEVSTLDPIISKNGLNAEIRKGFDATEEAFKAIGTKGDSPRVLHLATHGFFFPDPKSGTKPLDETETGFKTSDNPLIRSGLLLAGANYAWKTGKPFKKGMENGIITAYEISHMNLSNTELVVLSACETGLGDIQGNEGVYGLQRAFKIAGAKYLIMSLWQVPDRETAEFMTAFYKKWLEGKMAIPDAFRATQQEMRERFINPYSWAGFVLVE